MTNSDNERYWNNNVTQKWYSDKTPYTLQWFNELSRIRYEEVYVYKKKFADIDTVEDLKKAIKLFKSISAHER